MSRFFLSESLRNLFNRTVPLLAVRVPMKQCNAVFKVLKPLAYVHPHVKPVLVREGASGPRLILLSEEFSTREQLESDANRVARLTSALDGVPLETVPFDLQLGYEHVSMDLVLKRLLPDGVVPPVSFEVAGDLAHFNLRDECLPFKELIGQVVRDKNPRIRTVVNKIGQIQTQFRTFPLEVIAGEPNFNVEVSESGCRFQFDFSRVYWNSRLGGEHVKLVELFAKGDIVYDMFAGVGPFAIPAAKKGCVVLANDLNPASYEALVANRELNKARSLTAFNMDARDFVRQHVTPQPRVQSHVIMNLPAMGPEFCDCFRGVFANKLAAAADAPVVLPLIHCYGFTKESDYQAALFARIADALGVDQMPPDATCRYVREVAPEKRMICVTFRLPRDIATAPPLSPASKKRKTAATANDDDERDDD
jgi:tRNA (guanine37-N1)-methyltransferase